MSSEERMNVGEIESCLESKEFISDLLRIQWNYSMRWELFVKYLEYFFK